MHEKNYCECENIAYAKMQKTVEVFYDILLRFAMTDSWEDCVKIALRWDISKLALSYK